MLGIPLWLGLDAYSRRTFNLVFYRQYRGLRETWLREQAYAMFETDVLPRVFPRAKELVAADRDLGFRTVLVSGGLDFALRPAVEYFGFDDMLANRLEFVRGKASGAVIEPLLAGENKVEAMRAYCAEHGFAMNEAKAYSDSASDIPMLEAVGRPAAVNADAALKRIASARNWRLHDLGDP